MSKHPVVRIKICGVSAAIFKNEGEKGPFHTATIGRSYKDGDLWKTTNSFGTKDLAALSAVSEQATVKCLELDEDERNEAAYFCRMPDEAISPGSAFRFHAVYLEDDIFLFDHPCTLIEGDGLYRRFNRVGGFIEQGWYRFSLNSPLLIRAEELDFVG